ncbi:MAG: type III-A CRISPR-associated RAMP protein Csm3 [Candidatus Diapherotrites archaeon]|nr:type III-A CRISPR-associated RAMP protein Csm3 [Candidatus Diapherotrites archaeon]
MKYLRNEIKIKVVTGLHIGGNKDDFEIGNTDLPVAKIRGPNQRVEIPYIPGSSLKGKMRSLLEQAKYNKEGISKEGVCDCGKDDCLICQTFGCSGGKGGSKITGALIVRDFYLENEEEYMEDKFLELKAENTVSRGTGKAANPRFVERVLPGTVFKGEFVLKVLDNELDKEEKYKEIVAEALELLQNDYLGGCGTRGYGQVKIEQSGWKEILNK